MLYTGSFIFFFSSLCLNEGEGIILVIFFRTSLNYNRLDEIDIVGLGRHFIKFKVKSCRTSVILFIHSCQAMILRLTLLFFLAVGNSDESKEDHSDDDENEFFDAIEQFQFTTSVQLPRDNSNLHHR